ncbi:MAG: hypothetical protein ACRDON_08785 [Gaiellaceae bacterium]
MKRIAARDPDPLRGTCLGAAGRQPAPLTVGEVDLPRLDVLGPFEARRRALPLTCWERAADRLPWDGVAGGAELPGLRLRPLPEMAYAFRPEQARELANNLLEMADRAEAQDTSQN